MAFYFFPDWTVLLSTNFDFSEALKQCFTIIPLALSLDHIFLALPWILYSLSSRCLILTLFAMWRGSEFSKPSNPGFFLFNSPSLNLWVFSHTLLEALRNQAALSGLALESSLLGTCAPFHTTAGDIAAKLCSGAWQGSPFLQFLIRFFFSHLPFSPHRQPP